MRVIGVVLALMTGVLGWRYDYTSQDTFNALAQASARASCIVRYETGGTFDPNLIGAQGELGAVQLHPRGLLPAFYAAGWNDPFSPYQAIAFLDQQLAEGHGRNWTPVLMGYC